MLPRVNAKARLLCRIRYREKSSVASHISRRLSTPKDDLKEVVKNLTINTTRLVDKAASVLPGNTQLTDWKPSGSKDEDSLFKRAIQNAERATKGQAFPSLAKQEFESKESTSQATRLANIDESMEARVFYEPGTYVEITRDVTMHHGVVLGEVYGTDQRRWMVSVLTSSGEVWYPDRDDISFAIPNFIATNQAERCGPGPMASNDIELQARIKTLKQLRQLERDLESANISYNPRRIDLYEAFRSKNPNAWGEVTLKDAASLVGTDQPRLSLVRLLTTHRHLMNDTVHFNIHHMYRLNQTFRVTPKAEVQRHRDVTGWLKLRKGPIDSFVEKAKGLLPIGKRLHDESLDQPPCRIQIPLKDSVHWSEKDLIILGFILDSMKSRIPNQPEVYSNPISSIMRRVYPDEKMVDDHNVHSFLMHLGVVAPWHDFISGPVFDEVDSSTRDREKTVVDYNLKRSTQPSIIGTEDLHWSDPLESIRHDFGDLPVYVVDDPTASELDDGISIESVPGSKVSFWVHAHVADPASVLHPDHIFSKSAYRKSSTFYFINGNIPLLPPELLKSKLPGLSLHTDKERGPQRVLTFSVKLNSSGDCVDYKVRGGLINNVMRYSYDEVDAAMKFPMMEVSYPFGGSVTSPAPAEFSSRAKEDWNKFLELLIWMRRRRIRDDVAIGLNSRPNIQIIREEPLPPSVMLSREPSFSRGMPKVQYSVSEGYNQNNSRAIVAEVMQLACRAASRFFLDHDTPILRRYSARPIPVSEKAWADLLALRQEGSEAVPLHEVTKASIMNPSAGYSIEPRSHYTVGVSHDEGYTRVTSPLRRYCDLVAHWQIHALLKKKRPPFSLPWMLQFVERTDMMERRNNRRYGLHTYHWALSYLKRWMDKRDAGLVEDPSLLDNLEGIVQSLPNAHNVSGLWNYDLHVPKLGLNFTVNDARASGSSMELGQKVIVRPDTMRLGYRPQLTVVPV